jgi:hypothetical protein
LRRLTGVARGGALAIARHSLREDSWAATDEISEPSKAKTTGKDRNMARPIQEMPGMTLYRRILRSSWRHFSIHCDAS